MLGARNTACWNNATDDFGLQVCTALLLLLLHSVYVVTCIVSILIVQTGGRCCLFKELERHSVESIACTAITQRTDHAVELTCYCYYTTHCAMTLET
jgi:hypothetical protein